MFTCPNLVVIGQRLIVISIRHARIDLSGRGSVRWNVRFGLSTRRRDKEFFRSKRLMEKIFGRAAAGGGEP